ncbi:antibiotic biosynthesis monooxygenase (ABM) superfamily enzyme [Arthrobacter pascens]|uniref:hypothetical protein n=1 Tax=Arthrobacter pascens TaxID=1677 RepID=UPI0027947D2F|nr:hypothetical protein [Arthrobacter pascens]MDQ0680141.1 antibiotic biosynthesis monooxygenase (ABM) superfamily enzyme [Arthrobacter pascens]
MDNTLSPASAATAAQSTALPSASSAAPAAPSVHVRAVITWLAIFPLVTLGMLASAPLTDGWHPVLRALVLTLLVVPAAVYVVVPRLFAAYGVIRRRRSRQ